MGSEAAILILLTVATAVALFALLIKIPYPVAMVVTGVAMGGVHIVEKDAIIRARLAGLMAREAAEELPRVDRLFAGSGFAREASFTDPAGLFAVHVARATGG